ncbi:MAG: hypothetical protein PVH62_05195 [Anaerolineae bacterium]|jgi:hypothetical protein
MSIGSIFTTPGIGGIIAMVVLAGAAAIYVGLTRWILRGGQEEEPPWKQMGWPFE